MAELLKRLLVVPSGIRALFENAAAGSIPMYEIREIDPTHPGLDEFAAAMRGEDDYGGGCDYFEGYGGFHQPETEPGEQESKTPGGRGFLRLVCLDGRRLDL